MEGTIILGHGSKAPQALDTLLKVKEMALGQLRGPVEVASMEFNKPDIPQAMESLVKQGVKKVIVLPFFLFYGIHMQEDIPSLLDEEKKKYPDVEIFLAENIGADPRLIDILVDRVKEVS